MLSEIVRAPIRTSAFLSKEILEILRQPRLILTLALGPFLILLIFGVGYRNTAPEYRTLFVAPDTPELRERIQGFTNGTQLVFEGITQDENQARQRLRQGQVDLVIVVPQDPAALIRQNQQAVFTIYHYQIDPLQVGYINFVGQIYSDAVNRMVLREMVVKGQTDAAGVQDELAASQQSSTAMREALERGDVVAARQEQQKVGQNLSAVELAVGASLALMAEADQSVGTESQSDQILAQLAASREANDAILIEEGRDNYSAEAQQAGTLETSLGDLNELLKEFTSIQPGILVSPFRSETRSIAAAEPRTLDFYTPGVLALLLQHVAIAFGALSIVRERQLGTLELFRVSPVSALETLVGKYASFMVVGLVLAAVLTALVRFGLNVPIAGSLLDYAAVVIVLLFASLGIGFVISLLSQTASQAVQAAMIVLLASVFFSGFFIALYLFWEPVRLLSWALPITYGMAMLQQVMLLGAQPQRLLLSGLLAIGIGLFLFAWFLMQRTMARQ